MGRFLDMGSGGAFGHAFLHELRTFDGGAGAVVDDQRAAAGLVGEPERGQRGPGVVDRLPHPGLRGGIGVEEGDRHARGQEQRRPALTDHAAAQRRDAGDRVRR